MIAVVAVLSLGQVTGDEDRLRDSWPKLAEAWHALESYAKTESEEWQDGLLRVMARVAASFEAAGMFEPEMRFEAAALKHLFNGRYRVVVRVGYPNIWSHEQAEVLRKLLASGQLDLDPKGSWRKGTALAYDSLVDSLRKVRELRDKKLDDEQNIADEMWVVRKSLKAVGVMADDTPQWLRLRMTNLVQALVLKEAYPEPAKATEAQTTAIRSWIAELSDPSIDVRERATVALRKDGEIAAPFLREVLKHSDPEVVSRAKSILGIGHEPWREMKEKAKLAEKNEDGDK